MKDKSLGLNAGLNTIKTLCSIVFPLITFPYVARVLNVENIGVFNFCASVVSYFTLIAGLGINAYAVREGARHRESNEEMSQFASEVFSINVFSSLFSCIVLSLLIVFVPKLSQYSAILFIMAIMIPLATIGCEWVFNVYEEFAYITIRTIAFQVLALILLFMFVRTEEDLITYTIVSVVSLSGANIVNAISRRRFCKIKFVINKRMFIHLIPILVLFANNIAVTVYVSSDITLMGIFTDDYQTGLYAVSSKIYLIVKQMVAALIIVSIPRLSALLGENELEKYQDTANNVFGALLALVAPTVVGLFSIAEEVIMIISGRAYIGATSSLQILSIALLFCVFSWFYTSCVLIPHRKERKVLIATIVSATVNLGLNVFLIPIWGQNAAAATTVVAELISMCICFYYSRKYYHIVIRRRDIMSIIVGCACIGLCCYIIKIYIASFVMITIISIIASATIYAITLALFRHTILSYMIKMLKAHR